MRHIGRRSNLRFFSILLRTQFTSTCVNSAQHVNTMTSFNFRPSDTGTLTGPLALSSGFAIRFSSFAFSNYENPVFHKNKVEDSNFYGDYDDDDDDNSDEDAAFDDATVGALNGADNSLACDARTILNAVREAGNSSLELKHKLEQCGVAASSELVVEVLSQLRNNWEASFTFFLWAGKQPGYAHSVHEYHSMISILGKMRKFDTAWALIDDMRGGKNGPSLVTPHTLLIMIRRYSAMHDVGKAINTFYAHKRFKFDVGIEEFQNLLGALCRYKNVQDAEHLLFCNKNVFPFNTKSFNIILNGWCNVIGSMREAKRFWREMSKRRIQHDVFSYASIISCYSKANHLYEVLRLFKQMKDMSIEPDIKVYNAVIHALAKGSLVKESLNLLRTMEERGITPNTVTFNSLLKPICRSRRTDEAREIFDEMLRRGLSPTVRTFHAFFRILRTAEEVFVLLDKMKKLGCPPNNDTYIMLIRKFCRWRQLENVFKLWNEMKDSGICPDRSSYIVLIHGLFLNQKLEEAYKFYIEMIKENLLPEPKMDEVLKAWANGKQMSDDQISDLKCQADSSQSGKKTEVTSNKFYQERDFRRLPETKKVVRERGFSFWEQ
ncbi:pentatricopeptide repeat-containing protein At5g15010, mitochondrial-like [Malania oleifera]|uniref:pentatricopeptide repeat-containing protein At5g15010, mitochondrial-like n=1 Tax=Malania oleifera TaxID=397392 RepID=UPI0025ADA0F8|nr:pentatricopeptide repeat-containing protein At5g15010, mitochondrial-like [Malania oleifera]XP_057984248.1 pentatricopeptide repeat-containing protein At5g15010, mitochondrial-like [Malania oleifera]